MYQKNRPGTFQNLHQRTKDVLLKQRQTYLLVANVFDETGWTELGQSTILPVDPPRGIRPRVAIHKATRVYASKRTVDRRRPLRCVGRSFPSVTACVARANRTRVSLHAFIGRGRSRACSRGPSVGARTRTFDRAPVNVSLSMYVFAGASVSDESPRSWKQWRASTHGDRQTGCDKSLSMVASLSKV